MSQPTHPLFYQLAEHLKFAEIRQICKPLQALGITDFFYMRRYHDGTFINFATHEISSRIFFEKLYNHQYKKEDINNHIFMHEGLMLSELNAHNKIWQDVKLMGLGNAAALVQENKDYYEMYCFLSSIHNHKINQFYIENLDVLKQFLGYFDEKAKDLILAEKKNKLILPPYYDDRKTDENDTTCLRRIFLNHIVNKEGGLNLGKRYDFAILTIKEMECIYWLMQNKTIEETAIILGKSARTVEKQLDGVKIKFKCCKTSALIQAINELGLHHTIVDLIKNE
jgi:DNA-binding CsgD family transcriptional regulator